MEQEKQNIEFKESWRDEYLTTICAFANAQGGKLYLGVNDFGEIIGTSRPKQLLEALPSKIRDALGIVIDVNILVKNNKQYIEIIVPAYPVAISCKGNYYYRSGSTTQKLTGVELESFILRKRGATWDHMPHPSLTFDELDKREIENFKNLARKKQRIDSKVLEDNLENLLNKLHLINHGYLTNAALLLFTKDPEKYFSGAFIKVGYFENNADLIYQDEIHGSLFEQVDKAIELIYFKYMKAKISYVGIQRVEKYFVTEECMREAILNAVVHKQYESGIPIQISVYEDKLYIGNIGKLPQSWTIEQLYSKHNSTPYNPLVAHVFYLAGQIESWGRGVEKMCASCKANNLPLPIYHINSTDIMIQFNAPSSLIINQHHKTKNNENSMIDIPQKGTIDAKGFIDEDIEHLKKVTVDVKNYTDEDIDYTEKVTNGEKGYIDVTKKFTDDKIVEKILLSLKLSERKILECIIENPYDSYAEISNKLGITKKTVANNIKKLKEKGIIIRIGTTKTGYWKVEIKS